MMKLEIATIMRRAWQLAKSGAKRFGGSAREYLAAAIRMSWALWKKDNKPSRPVTYSLQVAEVSNHFDDVATQVFVFLPVVAADAIEAAEVDASAAPVRTGFLAKVATAAKRIATGIKNLFAIKVNIELVGANG